MEGMAGGVIAVGRGWVAISVMADPDPNRSDALERSKRAQAHSRALREQLARAAEAVAETEQDLARVHRRIAAQGGSLAAEAREHADRAEELAPRSTPRPSACVGLTPTESPPVRPR
jgi:hypothetical protein